MLNYHKLGAGRFFLQEYGDPSDSNYFNILLKYSPYHNLKKNVEYPYLLVISSDADDRVSSAHAFKFIKKIKKFSDNKEKAYLKVIFDGGHGINLSFENYIEMETIVFLFINFSLNKK